MAGELGNEPVGEQGATPNAADSTDEMPGEARIEVEDGGFDP